MKLKSLTEILHKIAPLELAEDWDNVGLLTGDPNQNIRKVMLTVDLTEPVFAEAKAKKVDLVLAYHPPLFEAVKQVIPGDGPSPLLYQLVRNKIAVYAMHTALDVVPGGVNDALAEIVGIADPKPLVKSAVASSDMCKLVVFVPSDDLQKVSDAVFAAGGGHVGQGKYSKCSFRSQGTGTFQCGSKSNPTIGRPGSFEQVDEYRLETILPKKLIGTVVEAMLRAHSYEEVAYDIYPLLDGRAESGIGRVGDLAKPIPVAAMFEKIRKELKTDALGIIANRRGKVTRAAVAAGSCGTMLREVIRQGCDFYLTGELKHHHALELQGAGVTTVCVGHTNSERHVLSTVAKKIRGEAPGVNVLLSRKDRDPFMWVTK